MRDFRKRNGMRLRTAREIARNLHVPRFPKGALEFIASGRRQVNPFHMKFLEHLADKTPNGCWEWSGARCTDGYGMVVFFGKRWGAHQASYFLNYGEIPHGMLVMHSCDNPPCINPAHLLVGTKRDNSVDAAKKCRSGGQVISLEIALQIRSEYSSGKLNQFELADKYGVTQGNISRIISRERFSYVE